MLWKDQLTADKTATCVPPTHCASDRGCAVDYLPVSLSSRVFWFLTGDMVRMFVLEQSKGTVVFPAIKQLRPTPNDSFCSLGIQAITPINRHEQMSDAHCLYPNVLVPHLAYSC